MKNSKLFLLLSQIFLILLVFSSSSTLVISAAEVSESAATNSPPSSLQSSPTLSSVTPPPTSESTVYPFEAEVSRLLGIIINSLYLQREVFLRELVSNAADANEKFRFLSLTDAVKIDEGSATANNLSIRIEFSNEDKTITIIDTGIGMTQQDLISNLGTIANSGTTNFQEALAAGAAGNSSHDMSLIGQFGVGFYSAFLVADKVSVYSKHPDDEQYVWESSADSSFSIRKDERGNTLKRGTAVVLHLKTDAEEFLNEDKIKSLVLKYSQFVNFPIYLRKEVVKIEEVDVGPEDKKDELGDAHDEIDDVDISDDENKPKKKKIEVKKLEDFLLNAEKPVWLRPKDEIQKTEYEAFYKSISGNDNEPYLAMTHFSAEGEFDFKALFFIPARPPQDFYESYTKKTKSVKLYARRVLVTDEFEDLMPRYLSWVKGVIDSEDLPLNVAREQLQDHRLIQLMSKKIVRKIIELITSIATKSEILKKGIVDELIPLLENPKENDERITELKKKFETKTDFEKFYEHYGNYLRLGCNDDEVNRTKILKVLQYSSSKALPDYPLKTTLDNYISNMQENQKNILYATGETTEAVMKLPQMKKILSSNQEVLILTSNLDEYCFQRVNTYKNFPFLSIQKEIPLTNDEKEKRRIKLLSLYYSPLIKFIKSNLSPKIGKVTVSSRLATSSSPCLVASATYGYSAYMEKMLKIQSFANQDVLRVMSQGKVMEINPDHPLILELLKEAKEVEEMEKKEEEEKKKNQKKKDDDEIEDEVDDDENDKNNELAMKRIKLSKQVEMIYLNGMIESGFDIDEGSKLATEFWKLMMKSSGFNPEDEIKELDVENLGIDEEDKETLKEVLDDVPFLEEKIPNSEGKFNEDNFEGDNVVKADEIYPWTSTEDFEKDADGKYKLKEEVKQRLKNDNMSEEL